MNQVVFLLALGMLSLTAQSSVMFHVLPPEWRPDLTLILLAWSTSHVRFFIGLCFSFVLGLCMDLMSGTPFGLFGLLYILAYIFFAYLDSYFEVAGVTRNYFSIFLASFVIFSALFAYRALYGEINLGWLNLYWVMVKSISVATFSWPTLILMNIIWNEYSKVSGVP